MRRTLGFLLAVVLLAVPALLPAQGDNAATYRVTIYNLTKGQVFSPPIVVGHSRDVALFEIGLPATAELAVMAEDGDAGPLADLLAGLDSVREASIAAGPIPPGGAATVEVKARFPLNRLSVAGMLVNTNDAFFAVDSVKLPIRRFQRNSHYALAYDAGSEANNEDCGFIPGPACAGAGAGVRDTGAAEGFVHVHNGVHGIAGLAPDAYDWRNPAAKIYVVRVR